MKNVDYIIVGFGLAGISFAAACEKFNRTFVVVDKGVACASTVAAGLYNPVILKRYSLPYKSISQFDDAISFFKNLNDKFDSEFTNRLPVHKLFNDIEDQNNWFASSDKIGLRRFLNPQIIKNNNECLAAPFDFGEVLETGRLDVANLQKKYQNYLVNRDAFAKASFDHSKLIFNHNTVTYEDCTAKHIVFAEGYGIKSNPYFNKLPLVGNKGEYLIIHSPKLKLKVALKSSIFIIPLGDDIYKVGATYNWEQKDWQATEDAKKELEDKFKQFVDVPYTIINQIAGVRPTTGDRRPLVGVHPVYNKLAILNGLGTRGVMAAPSLAMLLFNHLEKEAPLPKELDIFRFPKKF